ncbi:RcnB family protein [Candidatus Ferrigenium straubiae]|jgi:Ni/Co efflux regulator RcnB|uniref:RcnB family protein n=1 Tax=Candidatus Ferrigenium straubiae TaxID=2919506 RepID=UPI003F4AD266
MSHHSKLPACLCAVTLIALFAATPAAADRPSWVEGDQGNKPEKKSEKPAADRKDASRRESGKPHFDDENRRIVNDYYGAKFRAGKCPPGLAKKKNGCLPPGQAKKWAMGQPLPADLRRYDLPHDLLTRLPTPPSGHRYVRVASDILLVAIGTSMVVDAIEDIGKQF